MQDHTDLWTKVGAVVKSEALAKERGRGEGELHMSDEPHQKPRTTLNDCNEQTIEHMDLIVRDRFDCT